MVTAGTGRAHGAKSTSAAPVDAVSPRRKFGPVKSREEFTKEKSIAQRRRDAKTRSKASKAVILAFLCTLAPSRDAVGFSGILSYWAGSFDEAVPDFPVDRFTICPDIPVVR